MATDDECHLGSVAGAQLFHDVSYVDLDRAFLHPQGVSYGFVGHASAKGVDDGRLASRKVAASCERGQLSGFVGRFRKAGCFRGVHSGTGSGVFWFAL